MCYWVGTKKVREEMLRRLQQDPEDEISQLFYRVFVAGKQMEFKDHYVAIGQWNPELTTLIYNADRSFEFKNMRWGFPWRYTQPKTGKTTERVLINSTSEKVFFIHKDVIYKKRCIIPLDGYYEFFHYNGEVYPHFLYAPDKVLFAAGVWDEFADTSTGEIISRFSILTTPPNKLARRIHNNPKSPNGSRMLLLLGQENIATYLDPDTSKEKLKDLFVPYSDEGMEAYPVPRFLRKDFSRHLNTPKVREKIEYPELALLF
ncbi:MAG: SOS response-associated peptidase [Bacteroidales bacterium]